MNDIVINKIQSIQRCILRVKEEYDLAGNQFATDFSRQDAAILNITRACEQTIDLANHVIKTRKLGIPVSSADSFDLLARQHIISTELSLKMRKMVGFRNIAIHEYRVLDLSIVESVITKGLDDFLLFTDAVMDATR